MTSHYLFFERINHPGSGYKFPCNADGTLSDLTPLQAINYRWVTENRLQEFRSPRIVANVDVNIEHP